MTTGAVLVCVGKRSGAGAVDPGRIYLLIAMQALCSYTLVILLVS